jgi:hypothetical protein
MVDFGLLLILSVWLAKVYFDLDQSFRFALTNCKTQPNKIRFVKHGPLIEKYLKIDPYYYYK